jgi:hypothetical protein
VLQIFPGRNMSSYETLPYICVSTKQPVIGYTLQCRDWFASAVGDAQAVPQRVHFSAPYVTPAGVTLITASAVVFTNGVQLGVTAVDLGMVSDAMPCCAMYFMCCMRCVQAVDAGMY